MIGGFSAVVCEGSVAISMFHRLGVIEIVRGQVGRLCPFRGESEYSGFVLGEDLAVDHAFELRAGAFDVFR